jgi:hypothetical protein
MMTLQLFAFECAHCSEEFLAPQYAGFEYGRFLMRGSNTDELRLLDALSDAVYTEVAELLAEHPSARTLSEVQQADILQNVYGIACDTDRRGGEFRIGIPPQCPKCDSRRMQRYRSTEQFVEVDVPPISHSEWNMLSDFEKMTRLETALMRVPTT